MGKGSCRERVSTHVFHTELVRHANLVSREDYEKDDWQSEIEIAKEVMKAAIRRRARSSEHRASK